MRKRLAAIAAMGALGLLVPASPAAATDNPIGVQISQRTCREETPRQILLVHSAGSITCYGGTVGSISLGGRYVQTVHAGGYTGAIGWSNGSGTGGAIFFDPGDVELVGRTCTGLSILPRGSKV